LVKRLRTDNAEDIAVLAYEFRMPGQGTDFDLFRAVVALPPGAHRPEDSM